MGAWKILVRLFHRQKLLTSISLAGFVVSMAANILFFFHSAHHLTLDQFHSKSDRIFIIHNVCHLLTDVQRLNDTRVASWVVKTNSQEALRNE
ncbi:MAG: hypothetical protein V2A56_02625 [bacterium]